MTAFTVPTSFSLGLCVFVMGLKAVVLISAHACLGPIASALEFDTFSRPAVEATTPATGSCAPFHQHKEGAVWLESEKSL